MPANLSLELRQEFRQPHMRGTAIELRNRQGTGWTQRDPAELLQITYQGRRLLIAGDHGYATACDFSSEIKDENDVRLFAGTFGAQRAIREDPRQPWPRLHLPPRVLRVTDGGGTWLVVLGQRKWKVRGGMERG